MVIAGSKDEWANTSQHLQELIAAIRLDQWVATAFCPGVLSQVVGTNAGVPLAGLVACTSPSSCTRRIQKRLAEANLVHTFETEDIMNGSILETACNG